MVVEFFKKAIGVGAAAGSRRGGGRRAAASAAAGGEAAAAACRRAEAAPRANADIRPARICGGADQRRSASRFNVGFWRRSALSARFDCKAHLV
jgi:hypothetical protein